MLISNDMFNHNILQIFIPEYCLGHIAEYNKQTRTVRITGRLNPLLWDEESKIQLCMKIYKNINKN